MNQAANETQYYESFLCRKKVFVESLKVLIGLHIKDLYEFVTQIYKCIIFIMIEPVYGCMNMY